MRRIRALSSSSAVSLVILLPVTLRGIQNYIDPGTGSLILQVLIASFVGGIFMLKVFWGKVKAFFVNLFSRGKRENV